MKRILTFIIIAALIALSPASAPAPAFASEPASASASDSASAPGFASALVFAPASDSASESAFAAEPVSAAESDFAPPSEQGSFGNFTYTDSYGEGRFSDVRDVDWFRSYVADAYNYGFIRGKSENTFAPRGRLTLGEAVTLAARLRSIYYTGDADFPETAPYYAVYAEYAILHAIIDGHGDYGAPVSRGRFAEIMYKTLPPEALTPINEIPYFGICDVPSDSASGEAVYALYRAGILSGSDRYGTFRANSFMTRAEACAVMVRMAFPAARLRTVLPAFMPADVIFKRSADAVFMIETFDADGDSIRTGSGFFISETGLAVTALHVIDDAASATATMYNGDTYPLRGVHAVSEEFNLIIFSLDSDRADWRYLTLADSDAIVAGNTVYALGSPRALLNTLSEGIISYSRREVEWDTLIQFTAPISFGSGGSPLLNRLGQVVGVASSSYTYGQNLNLAVPINYVKGLEPGEPVALPDLLQG